MSNYKLEIKNIEKYAREFWNNPKGEAEEFTLDYIQKMTDDSSELHGDIGLPILVANHWAFNCEIPPEEFSILEVDDKNNILKSYSYKDVWDNLPKKKVIYDYRVGISNTNKKNIWALLEPLKDVETGETVCITNSFNLQFMMHIKTAYEFMNQGIDSPPEFIFSTPNYFLEKANNRPAGALNKYFDKGY
ncbi:MAG: hypothetical protein AABZ74_18390 [Cyanobacteriota bacterium]